MPFVNESGNADNEYLSDGMTETLISSLSQLPKLNVKARSSVFRYKGKEADLQKIATELNVQAILTGRVGQRGEQLLLSLELVDTSTENVIWSEQYTRRQVDLVSLQTEIARDVSQKLKTKLTGADKQHLVKNYTGNPEAFQLYMKGRYHINKLTPSDIRTSIPYFQQAIDIDPGYALAYTGLSQAYGVLGIAGEMPLAEAIAKAKSAGQKAIEIDNTLVEAHVALCMGLFWYDWDWLAAEKECRKAIEIDPSNSDSHGHYAMVLSIHGATHGSSRRSETFART